MESSAFLPVKTRPGDSNFAGPVEAAVADRGLLSKEELKAFHKRSNLRGLYEFCFAWGSIALIFAVMAIWPNPATILAGLILFGGRQMALAALFHEASHRSLFRSRFLNDFLGKWFMGAVIIEDIDEYRPYHAQHHKYTGQPHKGKTGDPDLVLVRAYPLGRKSFHRWLRNDLLGLTGLRLYRLRIGLKLGLIASERGRLIRKKPEGGLRGLVENLLRHYHAPLLMHAIAVAVFAAAGFVWLYLVWFAAQMTVFHFVMRVRVIAEHGMTERTGEMRRNTRTTRARWWERLFFAPHNLNHHLEHHLYPGVPCYRLARLHRRLEEVGALDGACLEDGGYLAVMRMAGSRERETGVAAAAA